MKDVQLITEKYKVDVKNYMWRLMMDLNENLKKYDKRYAELTSETQEMFHKQTDCMSQLQKNNQIMENNRMEMNSIIEAQEKLSKVETFGIRIDNLENEMIQMRRLN